MARYTVEWSWIIQQTSAIYDSEEFRGWWDSDEEPDANRMWDFIFDDIHANYAPRFEMTVTPIDD